MALVSGCTTEIIRTRCPAPVEYPKDKQTRAAGQHDRLKAEGWAPDLLDLIEDYGELRARCRAINER